MLPHRLATYSQRPGVPVAAKLLIDCDLSIASWFAMNSLLGVLVFDKTPGEAVHHALVQLVPFEAPISGNFWAPTDVILMNPSLRDPTHLYCTANQLGYIMPRSLARHHFCLAYQSPSELQ